jgi:signal peptidase II
MVLAQRSEINIGKARSFVRLREHFVFWPLVILGLASDLWTKKVVFEWLSNVYPPVHIVINGFLRLVLQENTGAAFGIASGHRTLLVIVSLVAAIVVLGFFFLGRQRQTMLMVALALFLAGILGNAYDRIFNNGIVRDFIDVHYKEMHWPAFNIADSMLCIAVGLLFILSFSRQAKRT